MLTDVVIAGRRKEAKLKDLTGTATVSTDRKDITGSDRMCSRKIKIYYASVTTGPLAIASRGNTVFSAPRLFS